MTKLLKIDRCGGCPYSHWEAMSYVHTVCRCKKSPDKIIDDKEYRGPNCLPEWCTLEDLDNTMENRFEALKTLLQKNPLRNDLDAYLYEIANWGLGLRKDKPEKEDYAIN